MAATQQPKKADPAPAPPAESASVPGQESLSQLIAKILDQLSVSAWLPAAALVSAVFVLGSLRASGGDVHDTITRITSINAASLVLLVGAVVVSTMLTQAFEFEAIRLLEGYWGPGALGAGLAEWRCRRHVAKREKLTVRRAALSDHAFAIARQRMLTKGIPQNWVNIIEERRKGGQTASATPSDLRGAKAVKWEQFAPPEKIRHREALHEAIRDYPREDRMMKPTRLGNTLRAHEERVLPIVQGDLEGFVQRVFHCLPVTLQAEHDQFRTRLNLYCSLVVVFVLIGAIGAVLMEGVGVWAVAITVVVATLMCSLSYRAAIASARGYGTALENIANVVRGGGSD